MRPATMILPIVLLAACAAGPSPAKPKPESLASDIGERSAYGLFLAGEAALNDGRNQEAETYFAKARAKSGEESLLSERSFTAALLAGDIDRAAALAPKGASTPEGVERLGRLVRAVKAISDGQGKAAKALLTSEDFGFPHRSAAVLLAPWAAAQAGDVEGSLVLPEVRGDRMVEFFGKLGQAHLFERVKRYDEAETDFKAITSGDSPPQMMVLAYGAFLERRDRRAEAIALYDAALARDPGSFGVKTARARAVAKKPAPAAPTIREGAAEALLAPAATMLAAKQNQLALAHLRMALKLDPRRDEAWIMLGDVKAEENELDAAREAYAQPRADSPEYPTAQAKLAWSYQTEKKPEEALKRAREAAASGDPDARLTLADLLRVNEKYDEAITLLSGLIGEAKTPDWRLLYARGVSYERLNRWPEAEADLQAALKLSPDDPEIQNYLGYSWIDRGIHVKEGMALVEKAVGANPKSGAMTDSLGWAHYRLGDYKKAVELLEAAVEMEAGEPEINDHLGDAYWRVGRRDEARFQWRRVLTLDPPEKIKAGATAKLASGLPPDKPVRQAGAP
jgi:tetratricopeptide (TPR) repeat protein